MFVCLFWINSLLFCRDLARLAVTGEKTFRREPGARSEDGKGGDS